MSNQATTDAAASQNADSVACPDCGSTDTYLSDSYSPVLRDEGVFVATPGEYRCNACGERFVPQNDGSESAS